MGTRIKKGGQNVCSVYQERDPRIGDSRTNKMYGSLEQSSKIEIVIGIRRLSSDQSMMSYGWKQKNPEGDKSISSSIVVATEEWAKRFRRSFALAECSSRQTLRKHVYL
jgi:hypothetical protein